MKISNQILHSVTKKRKLKTLFMLSLVFSLSFIAILPLFFVFYHVIRNGFPYLTIDFLTHLPKPVGEIGGGMANSLLGSIKLIGFSALFTVPLGISGGIYLSEYQTEFLAKIMRFVVDLLSTVPSIVAGLFIYGLIVIPMKGFSGWAGSAALAFLMFPVMVKTTEEVLKLVPMHVREAGLALGLSRWRVILFVVVRGSLPSIMTGVILAVARVAGETAPLIFTAFGNRLWNESMNEPISSLPLQIYSYAISPFEEWHQQAWAGAFLLLLAIFFFNILSRLLISRYKISENS